MEPNNIQLIKSMTLDLSFADVDRHMMETLEAEYDQALWQGKGVAANLLLRELYKVWKMKLEYVVRMEHLEEIVINLVIPDRPDYRYRLESKGTLFDKLVARREDITSNLDFSIKTHRRDDGKNVFWVSEVERAHCNTHSELIQCLLIALAKAEIHLQRTLPEEGFQDFDLWSQRMFRGFGEQQTSTPTVVPKTWGVGDFRPFNKSNNRTYVFRPRGS